LIFQSLEKLMRILLMLAAGVVWAVGAAADAGSVCELRLVAGQNWIALCGEPESREVGRVLGLDLPAGSTPEHATRITLYREGQYPDVESEFWLQTGAPAQWRRLNADSSAGPAILPVGPGFVVTLPEGSVERTLKIPVQIPTDVEIVLRGEGVYNVVGLPGAAPRALGASGLREAGFSASEFNPNASDELRIMEPGVGEQGSPPIRILLDPVDGLFKHWSGGLRGTSAENLQIAPGQALIIYTRHSVRDLHWKPN
jgi:hypothetical protein